MASQEEHRYRISLRADDFLKAVVDQRGIDVSLTLVDPAGNVSLSMDSPNGRRGEEPLQLVARTTGEYLLTIKGNSTGWKGTYNLSLDKRRKATSADSASAAALKMISQGDEFKRKGKSEAAAASYRAASRSWASAGNGCGEALALERLGGLLEKDDSKRDEAVRTYRLAISRAQSCSNRSAEAWISIRLGHLLFTAGDLEEAFPLAERAQRLSESTHILRTQAYAYNLSAVMLKARGEVEGALRAYKQSQEIFHSLHEPRQEGVIVSNRGEFLIQIGQPEEALAEFEQARRLFDQENDPETRSATLNGVGMAYSMLGLYRRAIWTYRLALILDTSSEGRASILHRLGLAFLSSGRLDQATRVFKETLDLARKAEDPRSEAFALADLAGIEDSQGRDREALAHLDQAYAIVEKIGDRSAMASALYGRASALWDIGRFDEAISSIQRSIRIIESLRAQVKDSEMRVAFFASRHRYYDRYIALLMKLNRIKPGKGYGIQAFNVSEQARARSLLDDVTGSPSMEGMPLAVIQRELLDRDSVLLSYSLGERESFLWMVAPKAIKIFKLPSQAKIEASVLRARGQLMTRGFGQEVASLSATLIPAGIKAQRLLIVPDGALHLVPFEALCNPGIPQDCQGRTYQPLVFDYEVSLLPSASLVLGMRKSLAKRPPASRLLAVFSNPVFHVGTEVEDHRPGADLKALPYTKIEARRILELAPSNALTRHLSGFAATSEAARSQELALYQMIHFATHNLPEGHPDFTGLMLSRFDPEGRQINGLLRAREIYGLHFPAELVVLSACGTGLGRQVQGEGPMNLSRAFLHAGAKRVVVSLWDVGEGATAELMSRFYQHLFQERLSPAAALREAQKSMALEPKWRHPSQWAAFVLQGEPL